MPSSWLLSQQSLQHAWGKPGTSTQGPKHLGWWPERLIREILRLKCYWYSDPDLWKQPSVTAQMSNLKCGLPAARKWQTGSLFSWGCSQLQPLAEHPSHKAGSWTFRACALLRSCCSTATCCWITVPVSEVSMVVLPTGSSICTRVWDSGLCSQDCLCILHETVTR